MTATFHPGDESEADLDRRGVRLTRDQRKATRISDLRQLDHDGLVALRKKTKATLAYLAEAHQKQLANGIPVKAETHARNCATHLLTVECIEFILNEAMVHYGDQ